MQHEFWLQRWQQQQIGFHQQVFNPLLLQYWSSLEAAAGEPVFVPLCGKSLDMLWLAEQGHSVVGNELSELAVDAFWEELGVSPEREALGAFERSSAESVKLLQGDFFALSSDAIDQAGLVFDRASLIALPPEMRKRYVQHMHEILPAGSRILLLTLEKDDNVEGGPPFNVSVDEVKELYAADSVELLASERNTERPDLPCTEHVFKIILK